MPDRAHLSIGEVLSLVQEEFPDITISKIRFLESQGLLDPERTPSGYRKFYEADIERLHWILTQQRDHFLPLKVIRDRFPPQKDTTREQIQAKYLLVKRHDRVGRMADTLEYSLVALPLARFDPGLVEELKRECGSIIEFDGDEIVIGHAYIERRMQPLNLYVEQLRQDGDEARLRTALREYGNAIKELAGAGIFPGDMLLKNFGVTRHERVVFYDYDEIQPMEDVHFRRIPPAASYDQEVQAEPYWSIGANDVFPEQFEHFLVSDPRAREIFLEYHRDLLDPAFWARKQGRVRAGVQGDVFPYPDEARFRRG